MQKRTKQKLKGNPNDVIENRIIAAMRKYFLKYTDAIVKKYKKQIDSTITWYARNLPRHIATSESDDLASEARIAFIDALKSWDPRKGELWTFVSVRVKGSMQDYLRKRGNDPVAGLYEYITQAAHVYMAFNREMVEPQLSEEDIVISQSIHKLTEQEQNIITLYYRDDLTFKEIGLKVGLSESQVSRIAKASTEKLKTMLASQPE